MFPTPAAALAARGLQRRGLSGRRPSRSGGGSGRRGRARAAERARGAPAATAGRRRELLRRRRPSPGRREKSHGPQLAARRVAHAAAADHQSRQQALGRGAEGAQAAPPLVAARPPAPVQPLVARVLSAAPGARERGVQRAAGGGVDDDAGDERARPRLFAPPLVEPLSELPRPRARAHAPVHRRPAHVQDAPQRHRRRARRADRRAGDRRRRHRPRHVEGADERARAVLSVADVRRAQGGGGGGGGARAAGAAGRAPPDVPAGVHRAVDRRQLPAVDGVLPRVVRPLGVPRRLAHLSRGRRAARRLRDPAKRHLPQPRQGRPRDALRDEDLAGARPDRRDVAPRPALPARLHRVFVHRHRVRRRLRNSARNSLAQFRAHSR